ncbi:MAG: hypothetical protein LBG27_12020 [Spirochaetaceae bacterium]|jgi:hypothetical protein|nr:hypothetical protein [Spirochaetaceae bacterium]
MNGGTIRGNKAEGSAEDVAGGGVLVNGTFTKRGNSIIYGNDTEESNKNTAVNGRGHAIFVIESEKKRNSTVNANEDLDTGSDDNWGDPPAQ